MAFLNNSTCSCCYILVPHSRFFLPSLTVGLQRQYCSSEKPRHVCPTTATALRADLERTELITTELCPSEKKTKLGNNKYRIDSFSGMSVSCQSGCYQNNCILDLHSKVLLQFASGNSTILLENIKSIDVFTSSTVSSWSMYIKTLLHVRIST